MTRLYDPTDGRILLDGVDLREYDIEDLHSQIGVIFQDFMRYEMTARENIAVGRIEAVARRATRSHEAARKSRAAEVIARLPGGYDQMLGRRFEGGRGSLRRRVAEDGAGARLSARRAGAGARRADGRARRHGPSTRSSSVSPN